MINPIRLFLLLLLFPFVLFAADIQLVRLKVEYAETPLGMDVARPRFSWQLQASAGQRGARQTAYQVVVTDIGGKTVWNSGKKSQGVSLNIPYAGRPLQPRTRYRWTVTVWDQDRLQHTAASWFETGLMNENITAWSGARWIGGGDEDLVLYPDYLPVFRISGSVQLAAGSTRAGFIYGANDPRLMDRDKNLFHLENKKDSSFILVELDIAPLASGAPAQLHVYRAGYRPGDKKDSPLKSFPVPATLVNERNKYEKHTISLSSVMGHTQFFIDGEQREQAVGDMGLNPVGQGGDFIAFPVVGSIGFRVPAGQAATFSGLRVRNFRSPSNVLFSAHADPVQLKAGNKEGILLIHPQRNATPMLRTTFSTAASAIARARLYVTARGIYEIYLNGKRIGNDYFNPGATQYNKTHCYQTYDVTGEIVRGKNALGALMAEGWWSGGSTYMGEFWNFFGDRQSLLAKLVITYADGKEDVVVTDPARWKYFNNGPVVYGSFFQGEVYDATKEALVKNWASAAYNDSAWKRAVEVDLQGHISLDERNKSVNMPLVDDYSGLSLTGQFGDDAVRKVKELAAVGVEEVRPGVFIYDMGQNMAGVPKIRLNGRTPGQKITLRFAEVKYPDLPEYREHKGMIMLENIRAAMAQDIYITKGGEETIHPRFTYHGYRFVEITGIDRALPLADVKGEVLSSVHHTASQYETSNPKVNKLWENSTWSTYANFLSLPTDCPQRNERLGWSGDISVFARTATYLATVPQFLRRHMRAMRDVQREDGRFSDVAPLGGGFGGVLWGSAGITVAWESFLQYGDKDLLAEHYGAMKRYIEFMKGNIDPATKVLDEQDRQKWSSLGDWLSPEYDKTEKALLWEAYFIYDLEQMQKIALVLGKGEEAQAFDQLRAERKAFFNRTYFDTTTGKTVFRGKPVDTQASYALPLAFGLFEERSRPKAAKSFAATITRENKADNGVVCPPYSLMTGFIGTAWISKALSDNGYSDIAYRLLQQTAYPSWLYSVEQGATTIWERLNSYTHTSGFGGNNRMNSFNHYSFGAVGAWMYDHSLGIQRDERSPGFGHFILAPEPDPTGKMTHAKGHYESMYGRIESGWERVGAGCRFRFAVPANTTATVSLPARDERSVTEGGLPAARAKGVRFLKMEDGKAVYEVGAGVYNFASLLPY
ncbi:family 78 glycoside hydrolase catalytic domain [Paraflavisolibacter sp. H34]|uniref:alpha-L-rhamnosidase n=1 Tax=Huijunlia imazamoxiresistens TaxID=3127457 RepID=UPI003017ED4C